MGESVQELCLIRGNPSNLPRASGPILPQTKNVEQFRGDHQRPQSSSRQPRLDHRGPPPSSRRLEGDHQGPSPSSRQNSHSRQPWQGRMAKMVAVITTKSPLAPALVRQQMAKRVAVIMTTRPMPALARHQMAEDSAIIASAIIMTTHSMPALARNQMAYGFKIILAMGPHPGLLLNDSKLPPRHRRNSNQWLW